MDPNAPASRDRTTKADPGRDEADEDGGLAGTLAGLGIVAVHSTTFEWGGYRYTNASDAIAAAKRAAR